MAKTTQIPRGEWSDYFDDFTRQHVRDDLPGLVTIEVLSPRLGDQVYAQNARLLGLSFDPHDEAFEVLLVGADHMTFKPSEIWVLAGDADVIAVFELVQDDGTRQLIHVKSSAPPVAAGEPT